MVTFNRLFFPRYLMSAKIFFEVPAMQFDLEQCSNYLLSCSSALALSCTIVCINWSLFTSKNLNVSGMVSFTTPSLKQNILASLLHMLR